MRLRALTLATLSALTIAACGGDDEATPAPADDGAAAATLTLTAEEPGDERFAFDPATLEADAGEVTIELSLPSDLKAPHGISLEGDGVDEAGAVVQAGGTSTVTADLKPGEYTFYCPVADHRDEGMEGTLTVG